MNIKRKIAAVTFAVLAVVGVASIGGSANAATSTPKVSTTTSRTGYVYGCEVINSKFSSTIPLLDIHGPWSATSKCGAGHQLDKIWVGTLPATGTGPAGPTGPQGATGATGAQGPAGSDAQALPYGVALVNISRGGNPATPWESLTTTIGSPAPMGDQATGDFRASCSATQAPCKVSVTAYATVSGVDAYPRIDITKENFDTGAPMGNCEYADGVDNNNGSIAIGTGASAATNVPLGIGGSLDCGSDQVYPTNGVADSIWLPVGRYDFSTTVFFTKPATPAAKN